ALVLVLEGVGGLVQPRAAGCGVLVEQVEVGRQIARLHRVQPSQVVVRQFLSGGLAHRSSVMGHRTARAGDGESGTPSRRSRSAALDRAAGWKAGRAGFGTPFAPRNDRAWRRCTDAG